MNNRLRGYDGKADRDAELAGGLAAASGASVAEMLKRFKATAATENEVGFSNRKWCTVCGGHVYIDHPPAGLVDVPARRLAGV